jgi:hypothetical protein
MSLKIYWRTFSAVLIARDWKIKEALEIIPLVI